MAAKLDINRGMENPKTSRFVRNIIITVLITAIIIIGVLIFNGKHNKMGLKGVETNIPEPQKDTIVNNKSRQQNSNIETVEGDAVFGDKTVIYAGDSSAHKPQ